MARDMENPDTQGKDMNIDDTRAECAITGCHDPAEPGSRTCERHPANGQEERYDDSGLGHTNSGP